MNPLLPLRACRTKAPLLLAPKPLPLSIRTISSTPIKDNYPITKTPGTQLSGRTCLITGGSSGIGYAIAERFLHEGAEKVIVVGRSFERLAHAATRLQRATAADESVTLPDGEVAARALEEKDGLRSPDDQNQDQAIDRPPGSLVPASERISLLVGDVSEASEWNRELEKAMQNVDILVNAAGISLSNILAKQEPADISRTLRTNLEGAMLTSRALLRASIRSRLRNRGQERAGGPVSKCIINISSLLAVKGGTGAVPYAASKAGLLGLTRSLSVEAASSLRDVVVRSNAIVPGYIETPMIADFSAGETGRLKETIPLRRFGKPEEIADAAVFLARNEYANNCVLNLDGGLSAV
ncbi:NAD(P)-binding protein [Aspergillus steynii IBT 23096]|uniref:NAD(P)-binding protein n=1 Tax=Aspergillus steynii IBT 23096 TaxID=1392250 RepID=A0A2I2G3V3_9EURO|nr:NAD(P)-binding protein [Aspergillus steynii IBT 23096]PLB47533.1 NAD(P)-binding protein [Aspergillus steynii IBT 23096]